MRNFFYILLSMLLLSVISESGFTQTKNKWGLVIELEKQDYVLHERIWLDVTRTNITSDSLRTDQLLGPNQSRLSIEIKDSDGELLEYTGMTMDFFGGLPDSLKWLLKPGEQDFGSFNLLELFSPRDFKSCCPVMHWGISGCMPKGTYTVQVLFEKDKSNELTFNIIEPFGDEKEVLDLIAEVPNVSLRDDYNKREPAILIYQEIIDKYPNSIFAEQCFRSFSLYSQETRENWTKGKYNMYIEMLERYPNSGRSGGWLSGITRELEDAEKVAICNKYIEEYPNTRLSKFAKQKKKSVLDNYVFR